MKVLSLLQPWATLVVIGAKKIETRSWNTKYRGPLLIHASAGKYMGKGKDRVSLRELCYLHRFQQFIPDFDLLPFGSIIGMVNLVDTFPSENFDEFSKKLHHGILKKEWERVVEREKAFGDYSPNRYGWLLSNPVQFPKPIPALGQLNIWNYEFEGNDHSFIMQCKSCGYAACADKFPLDKHNIDTEFEDWDTWCPKCESEELKTIIENLPEFF